MSCTEIHRGLTELHGGDSAGPTTQPPVELYEASVDLRVKHVVCNGKVLTSHQVFLHKFCNYGPEVATTVYKKRGLLQNGGLLNK